MIAIMLSVACRAPPGDAPLEDDDSAPAVDSLPDDSATDDSATDDSSAPVVDDAPDPACVAPGCVRSATSYGTYTRAEIEPFLDAGVAIDNGYEILGIVYVTARDVNTAFGFLASNEVATDESVAWVQELLDRD